MRSTTGSRQEAYHAAPARRRAKARAVNSQARALGDSGSHAGMPAPRKKPVYFRRAGSGPAAMPTASHQAPLPRSRPDLRQRIQHRSGGHAPRAHRGVAASASTETISVKLKNRQARAPAAPSFSRSAPPLQTSPLASTESSKGRTAHAERRSRRTAPCRRGWRRRWPADGRNILRQRGDRDHSQ